MHRLAFSSPGFKFGIGHITLPFLIAHDVSKKLGLERQVGSSPLRNFGLVFALCNGTRVRAAACPFDGASAAA